MDKKYQVFISSTYEDLKEERSAVNQCLLDCGCIPVGMEQFPASGMSQMEYIRKMLDDCDYYILILAGKYGSVDDNGVSYTEQEYDYALEKNIPIMSFVVKDIGKLANGVCENTDDRREKLENFRKKVCASKLVRMYSNTDELKAAVAISLMKCIKDFPAIGWIRANQIDAKDTVDEKIKQYLKENTISREDIEKMFVDEVVVLDGGTVGENNTVNIDGMTTALEEMAKKLPRIEQGDKCFHTSDEDDLLPDGTSRKIEII